MKLVLGFFVFAAVTFGAIAGLQRLDGYRCSEAWGDSGFRTRINFGCQVEVDGRWLPVENVKITAANSAAR